MSSKYISGIDGLRAIAVLSVLLFHAGFTSFAGGYVGVDVFFVISGYLITNLIHSEINSTGKFDFVRFYLRRVRRLFPALFVIFLFCLIGGFLLFTPQHFMRSAGELIYSIFSLSNFYFWSESGYFNTSSEFKPLLHTWSLSVEEQFYLIWPLSLFLLIKYLPRKLLIPAVVVGGLVSLGLNLVLQDGHSSTLSTISPLIASWFADGQSSIFYLTPFRIFEFAIGALCIWLPAVKSRDSILLDVLLAIGLALISYSIFAFDERTVFPSYNALIPCIGTALVIYSCGAKRLGFLVSNKLSINIGLISYSVYLVHWPIIVFYKYYTMSPLGLMEKCAIVAISILLGRLLYTFVETPFRRSKSESSATDGYRFGLVCTMLSMALILPAATAWGGGGWAWRTGAMPAWVTAQLNNSKQFHIDQYGGAGYPYNGWISGGASSVADLVVLGDSHARHYAEGLNKVIGGPKSKSIYISSTSCILLPGITRLTPGEDWDKLCADALNSAIQVIKKSPGAAVMLSESWGEQLQMGGLMESRTSIPGGNTDQGYRFIASKIDELREAIRGHQLILVGNVPGAGSPDVIGCFTRPKYLPVDCASKLVRREADIPTRSGNLILEEYAGSKYGVTYLNPYQAFCSGGYCRAIGDDGVFYSDTYHLSKRGSIEFVRHFEGDILGALNQKAKVSSLGE
ncbi:acyltransferase family protein [Pseudomonas kilonensis]